MSKVKIQGNASGTGVLTIEAPNTNTDRTITLPDAAGEVVTKDSSGNLLVGTTDSAPGVLDTNTGIALNSGGAIFAAKDGDYVLNLSRNTSDGDIVRLRKDGSIIGSIGTTSSNVVIGTGSVGLRFYDGGDAVIPHTAAGGSSNGLIDLGQGGFNEFKDLYLSGGVYVGGTGSANYLDDYEEGTWTPVVSGLTLTVASGKYTKIGRMVYAQYYINSASTTDPSYFQISGLPFSPSDNTDAGRSAGYTCYDPTSYGHNLMFSSGTSKVDYRRMGGGAIESITTMSGNILWGTIVYYTD